MSEKETTKGKETKMTNQQELVSRAYCDAGFGELLDLTRRMNKPRTKKLTQEECQQGDRLAGRLAKRYNTSTDKIRQAIAHCLPNN